MGLLQDCQHTLAGTRKALSIIQEERDGVSAAHHASQL